MKNKVCLINGRCLVLDKSFTYIIKPEEIMFLKCCEIGQSGNWILKIFFKNGHYEEIETKFADICCLTRNYKTEYPN